MIARTKPFRQKFCTDNTLQHILGFTLTLGLLLTLSYCDILKIKLSGRKNRPKSCANISCDTSEHYRQSTALCATILPEKRAKTTTFWHQKRPVKDEKTVH